jgi:hypothetical protein
MTAEFARGFRVHHADGTELDGAELPNGFVVVGHRDRGIETVAVSMAALLEGVSPAPRIEWADQPDQDGTP